MKQAGRLEARYVELAAAEQQPVPLFAEMKDAVRRLLQAQCENLKSKLLSFETTGEFITWYEATTCTTDEVEPLGERDRALLGIVLLGLLDENVSDSATESFEVEPVARIYSIALARKDYDAIVAAEDSITGGPLSQSTIESQIMEMLQKPQVEFGLNFTTAIGYSVYDFEDTPTLHAEVRNVVELQLRRTNALGQTGSTTA